jgi:Integrase zinc binding domain
MMEFNITLIHKPGKTMKVDPLSRRPDFDTGENDNKQVVVLPSQLFATISNLTIAELSNLEDRLLQAQLDRPTEISTWQKPNGLIHSATRLWMKQGCIVVVANDALRREVVANHHDHIIARRPGISKTLYAIEQEYWWPDMKKFITQYIKGCPRCQETKSLTTKPKIPTYPITIKPNTHPFETIAWDLIVDLPPSKGYDSILTITDHDCTKAAIFLPCNKNIDSEGITTLYATHIFPHFGIPRRIISD